MRIHRIYHPIDVAIFEKNASGIDRVLVSEFFILLYILREIGLI